MRAGPWKRAAVVVAAALLALVVVVRLTLGGGEPYPDISTEPRVAVGDVEVLVELDFPPGNVTASPDGRVFLNLHPFARPARFTTDVVFELVDGALVPFPDAAFQSEFKGVLGMTVDRHNRLWMIEPSGLEDRPTRLLAFDLATHARVVDHELDADVGMFCQDLRVSPDGKTVYLADTGAFFLASPAIVVFDVDTATARRVLEGHPSTMPQDWAIDTADGPYKLAYGLLNFSVGVDGLAISADGRWLYYAAMSHDTAYRVETRALLDTSLTAAQLGTRVEVVGRKPLSDGIELDDNNNLLITDVEHGGVAQLSADGSLQTLTRDPAVIWADGIALTNDGHVLFTDSEIPAYIDPLLRPPARAAIDRSAPHRIYKFRIQPRVP